MSKPQVMPTEGWLAKREGSKPMLRGMIMERRETMR